MRDLRKVLNRSEKVGSPVCLRKEGLGRELAKVSKLSMEMAAWV
jgi:hypothetical protein